MKTIILFILLISALIILLGCEKTVYVCPDKSQLDFNSREDQYIQWVNCMPPAHSNCKVDPEYEDWVNENCNINFKIGVAV